jgi:hypothetical protein
MMKEQFPTGLLQIHCKGVVMLGRKNAKARLRWIRHVVGQFFLNDLEWRLSSRSSGEPAPSYISYKQLKLSIENFANCLALNCL